MNILIVNEYIKRKGPEVDPTETRAFKTLENEIFY
jgi:hypothetical protein